MTLVKISILRGLLYPYSQQNGNQSEDYGSSFFFFIIALNSYLPIALGMA